LDKGRIPRRAGAARPIRAVRSGYHVQDVNVNPQRQRRIRHKPLMHNDT
jgi:hypothetical protein